MRRLLLIAFAGVLWSLPASDPFTGTPGTPISANWTVQTNGFNIGPNGTSAGPDITGLGVYHAAFWNADTFNNDQYSEIVIDTLATGDQFGPMVRMTGTGSHNGYLLFMRLSTDGTTILFDASSGTYTSLNDLGAIAWANGDTARLEVSGTTLTAKRNGSSIGTATSSAHSSGSAGIFALAGGVPENLFDSWTGGNVGGGGGTTPCRRALLGVGCESADAFRLGLWWHAPEAQPFHDRQHTHDADDAERQIQHAVSLRGGPEQPRRGADQRGQSEPDQIRRQQTDPQGTRADLAGCRWGGVCVPVAHQPATLPQERR